MPQTQLAGVAMDVHLFGFVGGDGLQAVVAYACVIYMCLAVSALTERRAAMCPRSSTRNAALADWVRG